MKILHTSDWHLGKRLENYSRHNEQIEVLIEICEIADRNNVDAVIIAGDLFDTFNPPTESVEIFFRFLRQLSKDGRRPVIAIAGNHDSPDRIEAPDPLARQCGIIFAGYPNSRIPEFCLDSGVEILNSDEGFLELKLPTANVPLRILMTPFANEYRLKKFLGHDNSEVEFRNALNEMWTKLANKYCDDKGVNILAAHLFVVKKGGEYPEEPDDEKPILHVGGAEAVYTENFPTGIQYVALGHLHRKQIIDTSACPVVYSGSPVSYSFAESNQTKFVIVVDVEPGGKALMQEIELTRGMKLLRKRAENMDDAVKWLSEHQNSLVELTLVSDEFITSEDRKRLNNVHSGIITIIPEVKNLKGPAGGGHGQIDLSKGMEALFADYFRSDKGQEPNEEILNIFRELLAGEDEQ